MKKILLTTLAFIAIMCVNAQTEKFWNFSDWTNATYESVTTVDGLIINARAGSAISVDANDKSIDGYSFTKRLKLGGAGRAEAGGRNVAFNVTGSTQITVYGMASSGDATGRNLVISNGTTNLYSQEMLGSAIEKHEYSYTGGAATLYLMSSSSGLNLYGIKVVGNISLDVSNPESAKEIKTVNYFDVLGKEVKADTKGFVVVKTTYTDGTVGITKLFKK